VSSALIDVAIVGAGPVGATLAALLARSGRTVRVFEAKDGPAADSRTLALSDASRERIESVGGWPAGDSTAISSIHVSQQGAPGRTLLEAREQGLDALGHTIPYSALERALLSALERAGVPVSFGAACTHIALEPDRARIGVQTGTEAQARLLVLADGGANASRIPGIAFAQKDYGQVALVAPVTTDRAHAGRAWERFTPRGPMALLPVQGRYALVWTATPSQGERLLGLAEPEFLAELQERFGDRAGRFTGVGPRASFPLRLRTVNTPIALRTAIIGNAAQALHPIAGQGLNLGLRDAAQLADSIARAPGEDCGSHALLGAYRDARRRDASRGVAFTDFLVSAFAAGSAVPAWGRGLALTALDLVPPARRWLAERMIHGAPAP
jgi:2-octaprenyl-6-methoxyphenol hydroxylase